MNIDTLHEYAIRLKKLGLLQIASDIDYLIAWLKSPEFNNGFHLPPHPAGENTYDEYSHHCPIPFIPCRTILKRFVNNCEVLNLIESAKDIITELLSEYTSDLEQTAIQAYIEYANDLIILLNGEQSQPVPQNAAYVNSTVDEFGMPLTDANGNPLIYNPTNKYIGIKWYDSNGDAHDINNYVGSGIWIDRYYDDELGEYSLYIYNETGTPIDVTYIEYETEPSNRHQALFEGVSTPLACTIEPGSYHIAVYENNVPISYANFTSYTGRYRHGASAEFSYFDENVSLGKVYSNRLGNYALAVYNNTDSPIIMYDFEYAMAPAHVFSIYVPDNVVGESTNIYATYDDVVVNPIWYISPVGPVVSNGVLSFADSGEYTITARFNGSVAEKDITLEYKPGWTTETVIDNTGDHPVVNTTTTDDEGNKTTEIVEVIDGEQVNTGYEIQPGGESVTIIDGADTNVKTFDGRNGFSLFFKFRTFIDWQPTPDCVQIHPSEHLYTILNLSSEISPYPGLIIRMSGDQNASDYFSVRIKYNDPESPTGISRTDKQLRVNEDGLYYVYIKYDPSREFEKFIIKDLVRNSILNQYDLSSIEFSNDVTATIGYTEAPVDEQDPSQGTIKCRQCKLDVLEFKLSKVIINEAEIPTVTIDNSADDKPYLITKKVTIDGTTPSIRSLVITPKDPTQEYVKIDDNIVTEVYPFADTEHGFDIELDIKVDYNDQPNLSASNQKWTIMSLMQETLTYVTPPNQWHGYTIRLESGYKPSSSKPNGEINHILIYDNGSGYVNKNNRFTIPNDHILHTRLIYDPKAVERQMVYYNYVSGGYLFYNSNTSVNYRVDTHNYPMTIGCALDAQPDPQPNRPCIFWLKRISYKVLD